MTATLNENHGTMKNRRRISVSRTRALHEPWSWYDKCFVRERNKGTIILFWYANKLIIIFVVSFNVKCNYSFCNIMLVILTHAVSCING